MRRNILAAAIMVMLGFGFCRSTILNTLAKEPADTGAPVYYTSIEISDGDSLWSIAHRYAPDLGLTTAEYIDRLRQMNRLEGDTIHEGRYLTVMYSAAGGNPSSY